MQNNHVEYQLDIINQFSKHMLCRLIQVNSLCVIIHVLTNRKRYKTKKLPDLSSDDFDLSCLMLVLWRLIFPEVVKAFR